MSRTVLLRKVARAIGRRLDATIGRLAFDLDATLAAMAARPAWLHLELTNLCNANCVFCPYQFQATPTSFMPDEIFQKAATEFVASGGGSVNLTPIVGDPLVDPKFLERVRYLRGLAGVESIYITTNGILLDRFGIPDLLASGITAFTISTSGFDRDSYARIYRSTAYERMKTNVTRLVEENAARGRPVRISIGLRTDRPLAEVMKDPDFQPILRHHPDIDFTWAFTSAGGRITRASLPAGMKLRTAPAKTEPCVNLYNGPIIRPDGDVIACSCVAAMDAGPDLSIGNIREHSLVTLYTGERMRRLRDQFRPGGPTLNPTCAGCEMYRNLDTYRTRAGRASAETNRRNQARASPVASVADGDGPPTSA